MASQNSVNIFYGNKELPTPKYWAEKPSWNQVHGIRCSEVIKVGEELGDADAIWTRIPDFKIGVRAADCVPILLAYAQPNDEKVVAVGAIHSGWRGSIERIIEHFFNAIPNDLPGIENWVAYIGPSIRACCYEVSPELITRFTTEFFEIPPQVIEPKKRHLDLVAVAVSELKRLGVKQIDVHPDCTFCSEKYFSYRRGDRNARQHSIISFSKSIA